MSFMPVDQPCPARAVKRMRNSAGVTPRRVGREAASLYSALAATYSALAATATFLTAFLRVALTLAGGGSGSAPRT